ncbi:hypothetical protein MLC59_19650, partial [Marinobacter bryozoorum]|uniref:hypothetical protein n=1 Tax=Marinobacter bryozoorum TaxID=256324 RepID=UPI002004A27F|nr:hypothetical protein [Marinobacter bryozoorum]
KAVKGRKKRLKVVEFQDLTPKTNHKSRYPEWYLKNDPSRHSVAASLKPISQAVTSVPTPDCCFCAKWINATA